VQAPQRIGARPGQLLDVDAALGRDHREVGPARAIQQHRRVELALDGQKLLDEDPRDVVVLELRGEHALRLALGLVGRVDQHDAAAPSAPTDLDLHLDDRRPAELDAGVASPVRRLGDDAERDRDTVPG
jgi:hypothetical protein